MNTDQLKLHSMGDNVEQGRHIGSSDIQKERYVDLMPENSPDGDKTDDAVITGLDGRNGEISPNVIIDNPFDINVYQHKKTLAQGMMDLALLSANANQLRHVLEQPDENRNGFFYTSFVFIALSIIIQVAVGVGLIWNGRYNIKKAHHCHMANTVNDLTLIGIFLITILNVFITAFGIPSSSNNTAG